ncbi:Protein F37C4.5 [Metarhizium anisopliae]
METVNRVEYRVQDLNTRSVILFPKQAQVVRDMTAINLKPGANEVTVIGLSPTIEQDSVKVEISNSSAIITNIAVKSSPNPDTFEEIYPDLGRNQSDCDGDNESESDSDSNSGQEQSHEVSDVQRRLREIRDKLEIATERVGNVTSRLQILESYAAAQRRDASTPYLGEELETYKSFRDELFFERVENEKVRSGLREQLNKLQRQEVKEKAKEQKAKEKVLQEREQKKSLKRKRDQERHEEQDRVRRERENFWPRYCYSVCITIEYDCNTQPSSRSISEADTMQASSPTSTEADTVAPRSICDLALSYVTSSAGWAPIYDLQLSTADSTAILFFNAQLINTTSETWSNCKVVLSLATQALFGGLDNVTPTLKTWKIKLSPKGSSDKQNQLLTDIAKSRQYIDWMAFKKSNIVNKPRGEMFMNDDLHNSALGEFEESLIAETSLATSYDLPDLKTLSPRSTSSKHRMARLTLPDVKFSYIAVAKYRAGANLKATIMNTSKNAFLQGPVGLTLDGRFLGHTVLPPCSAGCVFSLDLGVDPAIKVIYDKPGRREAAGASVQKERYNYLLSRTLTLQNNQALAGKPVPIFVRDQIPVSEDDRLRVEVLSSTVTHLDSQGLVLGVSEQDALQEKDWDKATATCKEDGEVNWHVTLDACKAVRLVLRYIISLPCGEDVVQHWDS